MSRDIACLRAEGFEPSRSLLHRDLNPENALLSGQVKKASVPLTSTFIDSPSGWSVPVTLCVAVLGCKMVAIWTYTIVHWTVDP